MRTTTRFARLASRLALLAGLLLPATAPLRAQDPTTGAALPAVPLQTAAQLDQLVGPIALYADPLLAQVLLASTFPDQVREAAGYVRAKGQAGIDDQPWDVSVKAVAHYPTVINTLDNKPDWMLQLGQAYVSQSSDVMAAVQRLRQRASDNGNLATNAQQEVVVQQGNIAVWPAQPSVIYVPVYDPAVVYVTRVRVGRPWVRFGIGFPIGAWFIYDWDWPAHRIVYTGWVGGGWIARSRPYVRISPVYVHERYRVVPMNRAVLRHAPMPRGPERRAVERRGGERRGGRPEGERH